MKVVSFFPNQSGGGSTGAAPRFGVLNADETRAVDATDQFTSLKSVLENDQLTALKTWCAGRDADVDLGAVTFTAPVPDAGQIICIGVNFEKIHPVHGKQPPPENISMFTKHHGSLVGHGQSMRKAPVSNTYDYEGEITMVVGKTGRNLTPENATDIIAGITILNDGSVREWQAHSVAAGKNFERASSIGPWMATLDELPDSDLSNIHLRTWLNDTLVQDMTASQMLFDIPKLLCYLSGFLTLRPGDIVSTGSPERTPVPGRESPYLQVGDRVDIEIDGVGRLTNPIESI